MKHDADIAHHIKRGGTLWSCDKCEYKLCIPLVGVDRKRFNHSKAGHLGHHIRPPASASRGGRGGLVSVDCEGEGFYVDGGFDDGGDEGQLRGRQKADAL